MTEGKSDEFQVVNIEMLNIYFVFLLHLKDQGREGKV